MLDNLGDIPGGFEFLEEIENIKLGLQILKDEHEKVARLTHYFDSTYKTINIKFIELKNSINDTNEKIEKFADLINSYSSTIQRRIDILERKLEEIKKTEN